MVLDVRFDLFLGLRDEAQTDSITCRAGNETDRKRTGVPDRRQRARLRPELIEPFLAPGEVVLLLSTRVEEMLAGLTCSGQYGLATVECLGGDLSGVVDAHELDACRARLRVKIRLGHGFRRRRARCAGWSGHRSQGFVGGPDEAV